MPANKEFTKLANQLSQLAKFYLSHLTGSPAEVAKKEKALLSHLRNSHKQLRVKGTALIRASGNARTFDDCCPEGTQQCSDGTCVSTNEYCPSAPEGLLAASGNPAIKSAPKAKKKATKKK